ncbi:unnamed protein product, partial [Polarella glacialis]
VVLGPRLPASSLSPEVLANCATTLIVNGDEVDRGSGALCPLGGPAPALAWLANHLNSRGLQLQRGQLVITGVTCKSNAFAAGDHIRATFAGLGSVETRIKV